ncbi:hypothetical protein GF325_01520 [Candidatus Bathyarchaeota archaeon]|nr:hypothetical protein [Candidatus Bathyarchaeota archaeon]
MELLLLSNGSLDGESALLDEMQVAHLHVKWENLVVPGDFSGILKEIPRVVRWKMEPSDMIFQLGVIEYLGWQGSRIINPPETILACDKASMYFTWRTHLAGSIRFPDTIISREKTRLLDFVRNHVKCVVKPLDGQAGRGIYLVEENNTEAIDNLCTTLDRKKALFLQDYIPNQGFEIRTVLIGDDVSFQYARGGGGFKHGMGSGGKAWRVMDVLPDLPAGTLSTMLSIAMKVKKITGLDTVAVDMLPDLDGTPWLLEWNPFFSCGGTVRLGLNIEEQIVQYLLSLP